MSLDDGQTSDVRRQSVLEQDKPLKRVRFADDIHHLEQGEGAIENQTSDSECVVSKIVEVETLSSDNDLKIYNKECPSPPYNSDMEENYCVNDIIINTSLMSISPTEEEPKTENQESVNCFLLSGKFSSSGASFPMDIESNILENTSKGTKVSRKRTLSDMQIEKQSTKLYSNLRKNNNEIKSANELKNAVYDAWCELKHEEKLKLSKPDEKVAISMAESPPAPIRPVRLTPERRTRKRPFKNLQIKVTQSQKSQEEMEESKME